MGANRAGEARRKRVRRSLRNDMGRLRAAEKKAAAETSSAKKS